MNGNAPTNRLASETSPYLQQHAGNPVDWYPWGDEALAAARAADRPILLSIGYSACHWCHVMAHESFEDTAIAGKMNDLFINIKVDREERPDLDRIYQTAHQLITQRGGGWPLTMFLTPDEQLPFFGGTYFPPQRRHGLLAFAEILDRVAAYYRDNADEARRQGRELADVFQQLEPLVTETPGSLTDEPLAGARAALAGHFDPENGGFGGAPKFPAASSLERLLQHWRRGATGEEPDVDALFMVALTLTRMAEGGIRDHVGGGFARYSVDAAWQIPHFEKMLYDNGPLLALYAEAWLAGGDETMRGAAASIANWIGTDLIAPEGGFYSSYDADSDGEEGAFYVWHRDQVRGLVNDDEYAIVSRRFGLDGEPNFEGRWHLSVHRSCEQIASELGLALSGVETALASATEKLLTQRRRRTPPARDEKILTSWNALAIRGLAIAGRALKRSAMTRYAFGAVEFIREHMYVDGRLMASWKDGRARFPGYLDDYAFLIDAIIEVLQNRWDQRLLTFGAELADTLLLHFEDSDQGGFFFTADDHEKLLHRGRSFADEAMPAGNGIAARGLLRLGHLLGDARYLNAAERTLRAAWQPMLDYPQGHTTMITALQEYLDGTEIVVVRGPAPAAGEWSDVVKSSYAPGRIVLTIPPETAGLPESLGLREARGAQTVAYICRGKTCSLPYTNLEQLAADL